jgi:hypothetical protein
MANPSHMLVLTAGHIYHICKRGEYGEVKARNGEVLYSNLRGPNAGTRPLSGSANQALGRGECCCRFARLFPQVSTLLTHRR